LDINIIIDIIIQRSRAEKIQKLLKDYDLFINPSIIDTVYYMINKDSKIPNHVFRKAMGSYHICNVSGNTVELAFDIAAENDLEDALQVACALDNNVENFVTADRQIKKLYGKKINVIEV
jgi:predicted nucleic acid-binding protein